MATPFTLHSLQIHLLYLLQHASLPDMVLALGLLFLPLRCKVHGHSDLALYFTAVCAAPTWAWPGPSGHTLLWTRACTGRPLHQEQPTDGCVCETVLCSVA